MYVKSTLEYERLEEIEHDSVRSIWIRGGFKNGKKIIFCHSYREHTNCLGSSLHAQKGCLDTFLHQWDLASQINTGDEPNEIHICGDINLDAYLEKCLSPSYYLYSLSKMVQTACTLGNFTQLVKVPTRFQFNRVTGQTSISCLDHVYTNYKFCCSDVNVSSFGNSDHQLISYICYSKDPPEPARTIKRRSYKNFAALSAVTSTNIEESF